MCEDKFEFGPEDIYGDDHSPQNLNAAPWEIPGMDEVPDEDSIVAMNGLEGKYFIRNGGVSAAVIVSKEGRKEADLAGAGLVINRHASTKRICDITQIMREAADRIDDIPPGNHAAQ